MQNQLIKIFYPIETILKAIFLITSLLNTRYTLLIAFAASAIGLLRVCKKPQFNKQYLIKVVLNNHGQNIFYIIFGAMGFINYLYYAPIALFFAYGIVEFIKLKYPNNAYHSTIDLIRNNKFYVMEGKAKLQIVFFVYCLLSLPLDFLNRLIKLFLMGQFLLVKYKLGTPQFRYACNQINLWIDGKTKSIGFINNIYNKIINLVYNYATQEPQQRQAS